MNSSSRARHRRDGRTQSHTQHQYSATFLVLKPTEGIPLRIGIGLLLFSGCTFSSQSIEGESSAPVATRNDGLASVVLQAAPDGGLMPVTKWSGGRVPVCLSGRATSQEAGWFADAIAQTWSAVSPIEAVMFSSCPPSGETNWVQVDWDDSFAPGQGSVAPFGQAAPAKMTLGFCATSSTNAFCTQALVDREEAVKSVIAHEFGHVLGFMHEQQRIDTECVLDQANGNNTITDAGVLLTWYDSDSIMNYCRGTAGGVGTPLPYQAGYKEADRLSVGDLLGCQTDYGPKMPYWLLPVVFP